MPPASPSQGAAQAAFQGMADGRWDATTTRSCACLPAGRGHQRRVSRLQRLAETEDVEDAGLDLQAAGEPRPADTARVGGEGDQVVALGGEPDLCLAIGAVG